MKKTKFTHSVIAVFLTLNFLQTLIPYNMLLASNNGPHAPEAMSFEPVDATDMVNLVTGDFSYVLPLLNVPSPEGGYPLALSYHTVGTDQDASWVGLGWSLNPGAITRNVNGYPDDWGKTHYDEFFYDQGWTEDFYSLGIGATFYGVDVGIGVSWGTNQSLGGYLSVGYSGGTGLGASVTVGTNGGSVGIGYEGFSLYADSNGNIGAGYSRNFGEVSAGVGLNYNPNSGLSGGASFAVNDGYYEDRKGRNIARKSAGVGIGFSSQGVAVNARVNGNNAGISTSTNGATAGDYDITSSTTSFFLPVYMFYINYSHTKVKYSLYKYNHLDVAGMLYPYHANFNKDANVSYLLEEKNFMDVNTVLAYDRTIGPDALIETEELTERNNIVLPNYDNYVVNAQGLSGMIRPSSFKELILSGRGKSEQNNDDLYTAYVTHPHDGWTDSWYDLGSYSHFYFENTYDSFLRVKRGNIYKPGFINEASDYGAYLFETGDDFTYDTAIGADGTHYKAGSRKRTGNYIETFTNKKIRDGEAVGFIEANGLNRQDETMFTDEGIGAYKITTLDGKTYHYSLPVYNFEVFYKNFVNENDEDENFFEIQKTKPYATHWLLTAVTGPDYFDTNANGSIDEEDYGYWVELDYGKWSDGYAWRGPNDGGYDTNKGETDDTYSYVWGRKQIYYLDQIKTRTHTALFVKSLREDGMSTQMVKYKNIIDYQNDSFDPSIHSEEHKSSNHTHISSGNYYSPDGQNHNLQSYIDAIPVGKKSTYEYLDIPASHVLKLNKIILLKNEFVTVDKSFNANTNMSVAYMAKGIGYSNVYYQSVDPEVAYEAPSNYLTVSPIVFKEIQQQLSGNILDIEDIEGLNLEQNATQVISFQHNYELAKNSPNSEAVTGGRLTLKKVSFKGKGGVQVVPPYVFDYSWPTIAYNKEYKDDWGYRSIKPEVWSLKEITTPTGGKIKIEYESDSYYAEAACNEPIPFGEVTSIFIDGQSATINFTPGSIANIDDYFEIDSYRSFEFDVLYRENLFDDFESQTKKKWCKITGVMTNAIEIDTENDLHYFTNYGGCDIDGVSIECINSLTVYGQSSDYTIAEGANGKKGGGLRVKSLEVVGDDNMTLTANYEYTDPSTNKITGITSYAPSDEPKAIPYISEIPSPMVMYGMVTVKTKDNLGNQLGKSVYEFETLQPFEQNDSYIYNLGEAFKVKENQNETFLEGDVQANKYTIYNKLANVGRLLSVSSYNAYDQLLSKTTNRYKQDLDSEGEIGVTQESYRSIKRVRKNNHNTYMVSSSGKVSYPSVLESTVATGGGYTNTTYYDKYDFLTGQVLETRTYDSKGNVFKQKIVPAYHIEAYQGVVNSGNGMNAKVDDLTNRNMLTQQAANYTYIKDAATDQWKETGVGITTWNKEWTYREDNGTDHNPVEENEKIWRKHQNYTWQGDINEDGTFQNFTDNFDWSPEAVQVPQWKKLSEVTRYDPYSMPLEVTDINGNKAATKMGDHHTKVYATANAGYDEMFYTGVEDMLLEYMFSGDVFKGMNANFSDTYAHTGKFSILVNSNMAFAVKPGKTGDYRVSVWAMYQNYENARVVTPSGTHTYNEEEVVRAGDWVQLNFDVPVNAGDIVYVTSISGQIYFDDFRMHPVAASMTSYVYNEWDELTHILGANNLATRFEYDTAGRLIKTYNEVVDFSGPGSGGFKLVKEHQYRYKLIGDMDADGDGIIDPVELFDPLNAVLSPENGYINPGLLTVTPSGGSGQYQYQFGTGLITGAGQLDNINYTAVTAENTFHVFNVPCTGGDYGYHAKVVKVKVIDQVTGGIKEFVKYYNKTCADGGGNPGGPVETPQNQEQ